MPAIAEAKELGKVTNKLILMIQMIAERYSRKGNFIGYSFREDMVSAATENLCKNALKFDNIKYKNPFAYYTTAIHNSFLQHMADEKKHRNIRDALLIDAGSNPSFNFMQGEKEEHHFEVKESDDHYVPEAVEGDDEAKTTLAELSETPVELREVKIRYAARVPGPCAKLSAGDFVLDPVTNTYVRLEKPVVEVAPDPVKKTRKKVFAEVNTPDPIAPRNMKKIKELVNEKSPKTKAVKEKAKPVTKSLEKKAPVKKVAPAKKSKGATIPETKLKPLARAKKKTEEVKKPVAKPAAKKVAAKKTTKKAK
jgi:hypothetical protein